MANKEQLAILKQGVEAWNTWREENPDAEIDLRGAKLDELDLSRANFSKADIRDVSFGKSVLIKADFRNSRIGSVPIDIDGKRGIGRGTNFYYSDLRYALFDNSTIEITASFTGAIIDYTSWIDFKIVKHNFFSFENKILDDYKIREVFIRGSSHGLHLIGKNLKKNISC